MWNEATRLLFPLIFYWNWLAFIAVDYLKQCVTFTATVVRSSHILGAFEKRNTSGVRSDVCCLCSCPGGRGGGDERTDLDCTLKQHCRRSSWEFSLHFKNKFSPHGCGGILRFSAGHGWPVFHSCEIFLLSAAVKVSVSRVQTLLEGTHLLTLI